jgi:hypothetical protein
VQSRDDVLGPEPRTERRPKPACGDPQDPGVVRFQHNAGNETTAAALTDMARRHQLTGQHQRRDAGRALVPYLQRTAGNAAICRLLSDPTTSGQPLDAPTRDRLASSYRSDLSGVRLWLDSAATSRQGAVAFTIGQDVVMDPARYQPGSTAGDVLLAHEVAHTVQQRGTDQSDTMGARNVDGATASEADMEADADRAAIVATHDTGSGFFPRLRAALSLQRCKGCTEQELTLAQRFRDETDPAELESLLRGATDDQVDRAEQAASGDSLHADAIGWEQAVRAKDFARIVALNTRTGARFRAAYAPRILAAIMAGQTSIRIETTASDFVDFIRSSLDQLIRIESGFRLVVELLATRQPVVLRPAQAGADTTQAADEIAARMGRQPDGTLSPGVGSGSTISLNQQTAANQVVLGAEGGTTKIIDQPPDITVGHELIHALHNARGENIAPLVSTPILRGLGRGAGLVRDVTGEPESPEELRTITGQSAFQQINYGRPDTAMSYPLGPGISENDLRHDRGLPARTSHWGGTDSVRIPRRDAHSVDDVVARYRIGGTAAVSPAVAVVIRSMLMEAALNRVLELPEITELMVPHPDHIRMHIHFVLRNDALVDAVEGLTVR